MIINQNRKITEAARSWNPIRGTHPSSQFGGFHFPPNSIRGMSITSSPL